MAVSEHEIIEMANRLARSGLYAEPTSVHAAASHEKLLRNGSITEDETTVVVLTGSGLKATYFYLDQEQEH